MRLDINLATQPYQDMRQFWMRWGMALTAAIAVTMGLTLFTAKQWLDARSEQQQISRHEGMVATLEHKESEAKTFLSRAENRSTRDRSQFLNDLFHRKAFSWTRVFEDLERVMPAHLHVVSIHPELTSENELEIKLVVAGESHERALELVKKMEDSRRFQNTQINKESMQPGKSADDAVEFDISARYVPETAENGAGGAE